MSPDQFETATLAGGCFWCTEAVFKRLKGVSSIEPGYAGGTIENPTYEQVSSGNTGHAEAIQIKFDPKVISFNTILDVFWATHDPTTVNQQGNDYGPQYRSIIFYHDESQKQIAEKSKKELEESKTFGKPIVTKITPFTNFYKAENYHKDYYDNNRQAPYCQIIIDPKIKKLHEKFEKYLKPE